MTTDYHAHILPGIDDGAKCVQESLSMLRLSAEQGVERQILTPHFYWHKEKSVEDFLRRRRRAYEKIAEQTSVAQMRLGAEVALEMDIPQCEHLGKLVVEGTRLLLLEPSYYGFTDAMVYDIEQIAWQYAVKPVIAHVHRYVSLYSAAQMERILSLDAVFQVNTDACRERHEKKFVKKLCETGKEIVLGTDCHDVTLRPPNFSQFQKLMKKYPDLPRKSDEIFEKYAVSA